MEIFKKRDFGELIGETISFFAKEFKLLSLAMILFVGPILLLSILISQHYGITNQAELLNILRYGVNIWDYIGYGPIILIQLFSLLQSVVLLTIITVYIKLFVRFGRGNFGITEIWNEFIKHIGQTLIGLLIAAFLIFVGTVILVIPGIYLAVVFYMLVPIIIFEKEGFGKGISRSFELIRGNWWKAFGAFIVLFLLTLIANMIISAIFRMFFMFTYGSLTLMAIYSVIIGIISIIISSVTSILPAFLYTSIIADQENPGLMEKIEKISKDDSSVNIFEIKDILEKPDNLKKKEKETDWTDLLDEDEKQNRFEDDDNETDRFKPKY